MPPILNGLRTRVRIYSDCPNTAPTPPTVHMNTCQPPHNPRRPSTRYVTCTRMVIAVCAPHICWRQARAHNVDCFHSSRLPVQPLSNTGEHNPHPVPHIDHMDTVATHTPRQYGVRTCVPLEICSVRAAKTDECLCTRSHAQRPFVVCWRTRPASTPCT